MYVCMLCCNYVYIHCIINVVRSNYILVCMYIVTRYDKNTVHTKFRGI